MKFFISILAHHGRFRKQWIRSCETSNKYFSIHWLGIYRGANRERKKGKLPMDTFVIVQCRKHAEI